VPAAEDFTPGALHWNFKALIPPRHIARLLFIRWSNDVPVVATAACAYYKAGEAPAGVDLLAACGPPAETRWHSSTNTVGWTFSLINHHIFSLFLPNDGTYRALETPARLVIRPRHQGVLRLVDCAASEDTASRGKCGVELRIFLEPMNSPAIRTDPLEFEGANYVAGYGLNWTIDEALKAIKEWPVDQ
jgi:hypothetical protein